MDDFQLRLIHTHFSFWGFDFLAVDGHLHLLHVLSYVTCLACWEGIVFGGLDISLWLTIPTFKAQYSK